MKTSGLNNRSFFSDIFLLSRDAVSISLYLIGLPHIFVPFLLSLSLLVIDTYLPSNLWIVSLGFIDTITYFYIAKVMLLREKSKVEVKYDFFRILKILLFSMLIVPLIILACLLLWWQISLFVAPLVKLFFTEQSAIQLIYMFPFILGFIVYVSYGTIFWFMTGEYIREKEWRIAPILKGYFVNIFSILRIWSRLLLLQAVVFLVSYLITCLISSERTNVIKILVFMLRILTIPFGVMAVFLSKRFRRFLI